MTDLRASHRARSRTVSGLRTAYLRGELSDETFEGRVAVAYAAVGSVELAAVRADLPTLIDRIRLLIGTVLRSGIPGRPTTTVHLELVGVPTGRTLLVGRSSTCDVRFDDASVSRVHAELRRTVSGWLLADCRSTNGTYVNGCRVDRARVADGDEIDLGAVTVVIRSAA